MKKRFVDAEGRVDMVALSQHNDSMPVQASGIVRNGGGQDYPRVVAELHEDFMEFGAEVKKHAEATSEALGDINARLVNVEQVTAEGSWGGVDFAPPGSVFGVADRLAEAAQSDAAFANIAKGNQATARLTVQSGVKAAIGNDGNIDSNNTSYPGNPDRRTAIVGEPERPLTMLEAFPYRSVTTDQTEFVQVTSEGGAAEQEQEGDTKSEMSLEGTLVQASIVTIAAWTAASKQVLSDQAMLRQEIDRVLRYKCRSRAEHQLINGPGGQGRINGLLNQATSFVPTIGQTPADIIGESLTRQSDNGYMPSLVIMNPMDWYSLQLTKSNTEGEYIFGSPIMPVPPALWNARVVTSSSLAEGTALTIDTSFTTITDREQPGVTVSTSHSDFFTRNLVAILGEMRLGLEVLDTAAVYKMDINTSN